LSDIGNANEVLKDALDLILEASGSGYVYDVHPLQCIYRDFATLQSHRSLSPIITKETYKRVARWFRI